MSATPRRPVVRLLAVAAVGLSAVAVVSPATLQAKSPPEATVFISEIHYDNDGVDVGEAVEVFGPAGTDLTGWSIVRYNGSNPAAATVYTSPAPTVPLGGVIPDLGGGYGVVLETYPSNGLQNGDNDGLALVDNLGEVRQLLSYEGAFTASNGPAAGMLATDIGVFQPSNTPIGQSLQFRRVDGATTYTAGDHIWSGPETSTFGAINPVIDAPPPPPPPPPDCPADEGITLISAVQGSGDVTPLAGQSVIVEGVVVGDYQGPSPTLRGFYLQEEDADHDADPMTSEGIFVFNGNDVSVALGDLVQVHGRAEEFQGQTQLSATTCVAVIEEATTGLVTPATVTLPVPSADYLERYEGMLVTLPQSLSVTEHFQLGRFGQVFVSSGGRLDQPTSIAEPGADAIAIQAANDLNKLIVDDTLQSQNPDPIIFGRNGDPLSASNTLRGGDLLTGATGILTYTWAGNAASGNAYRLRPVSIDHTFEFTAANERPSAPPEVGGSVQVASFNVLNYFVTLGTSAICGPVGFKQACRGADNLTEFERQRVKLLAALVKLDADVVGLMELENTELADGTPVEPMADLVEGLNDLLGAGTYAYVDTGAIGTDVIKVGLLYKPGAVVPLGDHAILDSSVDPRFDDSRSRPALAQSFAEVATGEIFTVTVNHLKSKGCGESSGADADQGDGQGCWNATRTAAAEALRDWLASDPTGIDDDDHLIIGDLNAYAMEDPVQVLVDAGYVDLAKRDDDRSYSYVFDGQWGSLDHVLASPSLVAQATGAASYHINADEPSVLDYNTNFKTPNLVASLFAPDEFRTSDHDPIVVGLDLSSFGVTTTASPAFLHPANGNDREVNLRSMADRGRHTDTRILAVDPAAGATVLGPESLMLRADAGVTYTIWVLTTKDGQSVLTVVTVPVLDSPPAFGKVK